jgi:hypothetical protein
MPNRENEMTKTTKQAKRISGRQVMKNAATFRMWARSSSKAKFYVLTTKAAR